MLRSIGSAIAGYIVMFIGVFILMTLSWFIVGASGAFKPAVWEVTALWLVLMLASAFVAAVAGGYTTAAIATDAQGPKILVGIVIVLGILSALPLIMGSTPAAELPRADDVPMMEAMMNGIQPVWTALLNPIIGAVGVLYGARMRSKRST